jgi:hypothetical protein
MVMERIPELFQFISKKIIGMTRIIYAWIFTLAIGGFNITGKSVLAQSQETPDTISMSAGYLDEVYYSMGKGIVQTSPRTTWDIAFLTQKMSSGILTNDGSGVILYTYPKSDTSGWASVDTNGLTSWKPMFNDPDDWENGAFSRNALGHPDYGWGKYNTVTHDVVGDSLFIIVLRDQSLRKLWIVKKKSVQDIYVFKYANIDGSNEQQFSLDLSGFLRKDFYGFSLETNAPVDFQPAKTDWDILFTKYMSVQPNGSPYAVTGILSNNSMKTKEFHQTPVTLNDWQVGDWDSTRSTIGYDWKYFDMNNFVYVVEDSLVYFILDRTGGVYKLVLTRFDGSSTGIVGFNKEKISTLGVSTMRPVSSALSVSPNPAKDSFTVFFREVTGPQIITVTDLAGRIVHKVQSAKDCDSMTIDSRGFSNGTYIITLTSPVRTVCGKVIISR